MTTVYCLALSNVNNPSNASYAFGTNTGIITNNISKDYNNSLSFNNFPITYKYIYNNTTGSSISANISIAVDISCSFYLNNSLVGNILNGFSTNPFPIENMKTITLNTGYNTLLFNCFNSFTSTTPGQTLQTFRFVCQCNTINTSTMLFYTPNVNTDSLYSNWSIVSTNFKVLSNVNQTDNIDLLDIISLTNGTSQDTKYLINTNASINANDFKLYSLYDSSYVKPNNLNLFVTDTSQNIVDISTYFSAKFMDINVAGTYSYVIPKGVIRIATITIGGGGGGGGGGGANLNGKISQAGGGGGSSFPVFTNMNSTIKEGNTITIVVGSGGTPGARGQNNVGGTVGSGTDGTNGGNTYITYNSTNYGISYGGIKGLRGANYISGGITIISNGGSGSSGGVNGANGTQNTTTGGAGGTFNLTSVNFPQSVFFRNLITNNNVYGQAGDGGKGGTGGGNAPGGGTAGTNGYIRIYFFY